MMTKSRSILFSFLLVWAAAQVLGGSGVAFAQDADSLAFANAPWDWTTEESGACRGYAQFTLFGRMASISVVKYPEDAFMTEVDYRYGDDCITTGEVAEAVGADVALNGSYFNTKTFVSTVALCMDGELVTPSQDWEKALRVDGLVCFDGEGRMTVLPYKEEEAIDSLRVIYRSVMAAGPLLVSEGRALEFRDIPFNTTTHPRTMIGVTGDRNIVMVVVDGRFPGNGCGASSTELATIARYLGMDYALNLDGGGSSTIWTRGFGVMNHPYDNGLWDHEGQRRTPTVIVARRKQ